MTKPRYSIIKEDVVGTYHCMSRCVRRAHLCGYDPHTNRNYDHRKRWLEDRLAFLAHIFFIDVCAYAIMSNHLHVILRNRPDLTKKCTAREIAFRWWLLCPGRRTVDGFPEQPTEDELKQRMVQTEKMAVWRSRLSSISWFMGQWKQPLAHKANAEDGGAGRFWEGRFKSVALLDSAAILICTAYVDLNPVRAGMAPIPERSPYTSVRRRVLARQARCLRQKGRMRADEWLCPLQDEGDRKGFLKVSFEKYLELLDWSGRQLTTGKKGVIPKHLAPILKRLDVNEEYWLQSCGHFGSLFYRVAGRISNMAKAAVDAGQCWMKGQKASKMAFIHK